MYRHFFGLRERPFDLTPNPRFLVLTDAHKEALSNLDYAIASRCGITALIGEAGTGKTTIIRAALERQPQQVHTVYLHNPALTRAEFVETLATRFELSREARASKAALLTELESALRERLARGESSALIVDEAQSLPLELLEEIRLLGNIETSETKLLSIVLAGQPELGARLRDDALRQLKQRIALRCELRPLTQSETAGYLAGRLRAAGGVGAQIFTREAVMLIHKRSGGIPRLASVIANNAMVSAFAMQRRPVSSQIVDEVCRDLDLTRVEDRGAEVEESPVVDEKELEKPERTNPKVLSFDGTDQNVAGVDESEPPDHAAETRTDADASMFNSVYPKRRRFSFF
jgi:type II secretory pathway predicted ATPase ExeA